MTKDQVRDALLTQRRAMSSGDRHEAADAIAMHLLAVPVVSRARRVACYLSMPSEPGTGPLLDGLHASGTEVLVPVALDDQTLDWVVHDPGAATVPSAIGVPEPGGPRLGVDAVATCDVVVVPALAVDHAGHRLGRGAGYYDRALAHVGVPLCAVVFTHELLPDVPHEAHDVPVHLVVTPSGLFRVP